MKTKLEQAIQLIDQENSKDPNVLCIEGKNYPKELVYAQRMTKTLLKLNPSSSEALQIAVRAQHICRWKIERSTYPMDRVGYFKWRNDLKKLHANITRNILEAVGYDETFISRVSFLIHKKQLKKDTETQMLEDTACLVFLEYYFNAFSHKHSEEKIIDIIQKTWVKISEKAQNMALHLELSAQEHHLIQKALS